MSPRPDCDVLVVGGGPAGSVAAHALASRGAKVRVVDSQSFPRPKTCGGGVVGRARAALPIDLDPIARGECRVAEVRIPSIGVRHEARSSDPIVTMTERRELDLALLDAARHAGARIDEGTPIQALERIEKGVRIRAGGQTLTARWVIAADGAAGVTARLAGWKTRPRQAPALEAAADPPSERDALVARFVLGEPGDGYSWSFPKQGGYSIGACTTVRTSRERRAELEDALETARLDARISSRPHGFVIPVTFRPGPVAASRVLLVGDAAGAVDPLLCEGIGGAAHSGKLAAHAIAGARDGVSAERRYARLMRPLRLEYAIAERLASLLYGRPRIRGMAFRRMAPTLCEAMISVVGGRLSYRQLLLRAPRGLIAALWAQRESGSDVDHRRAEPQDRFES